MLLLITALALLAADAGAQTHAPAQAHKRLAAPGATLSDVQLEKDIRGRFPRSKSNADHFGRHFQVRAVCDDGVKFTMGQFRALYLILPPQNQQGVMQNRKAFVEQLALFRKLSAMAEKDGLDKQTPTKEAIEYQRMVFLSQAKITA